MSEIQFNKYAVRGAYHWTEYSGPVHRLNAYTRAKYHAIITALRAHGIAPNQRVLDVGCGDGALSGLIASALKASIFGLDTTPASITLARQEFSKRGLTGEFREIDGYQYPYDDATFFAVVCSDVIEHVRQPEAMLAEMWRVLVPGGILVVTTPIRYTEAPLDPMHVQEWFPEEFRKLCTRVLGVRIDLRLSHPVALAELYASPAPIMGRLTRLSLNILSKLGTDVFMRTVGFRAFSTQTMVARKPIAAT